MGDGSGHVPVHGSTTQSRNHEAAGVKLEAAGSHVTALLHTSCALRKQGHDHRGQLKNRTSVPIGDADTKPLVPPGV